MKRAQDRSLIGYRDFLEEKLKPLGMALKRVPGDGNYQFHATGDQLRYVVSIQYAETLSNTT